MRVRVLDNLSSGSEKNLNRTDPRLEFILGDIRDLDTCRRAARGCSGIFHQAALVSVAESVERPMKNHTINDTGTVNILESARLEGVERIVFASSAAIYGDDPNLPKEETDPPQPISPYAVSKLSGEHYLACYAKLFGLQAVALRYFNVYGPRQDPSSMYSGVISKFADCLRLGQRPTIFGDGTQSRDFVHVSDVAEANWLAMTLNAPKAFQVFNIASGRATNLLDLLAALQACCPPGRSFSQPYFKAARVGDIKHSLAAIDRAKTVLRFNPIYADICTGIKTLFQPEKLVAPVTEK